MDRCCNQKSITVARRTVQSQIWTQNPLDEFAKNTPRLPVDRRPTRSSIQKGEETETARACKQQKRLEDFDIGLPQLTDDYDIDLNVDVSLGFGSGIRRIVHKRTRMPRALLSIPKSGIPSSITCATVSRQLELLCKLDHPNIVPFRECFEDHKYLRLVYEWCQGGLFMAQLSRYSGMLAEGHVAQIIRELLSALAAGHAFGIHHLDLGFFSIFLQHTDRLSPIKVFGFGLAGFLFEPVSARNFSKSNKHFYASPELFASSSAMGMQNAMKHTSDIWAVGALLYTLCSGRPPFGTGSVRTLSARVRKDSSNLEFGLEFVDYSLALKDIVAQMMRVPWMKRLTATTALKHSWVTNTKTLQQKDGRISQLAMSQLKGFAEEDHVKQTVARLLTDIGLTSKAYDALEKKFEEMDLNGDGTLTLGELVEICSKMPGMTEKQIQKIVEKLDRNGNCNVDISEFVAALVLETDELDERLIKKAFSKIDKNHDARVNKKELYTVLRQYSGSLETQQVSNFVSRADEDKDQKIDYREFCQLFPQVRCKIDEIDRRMVDAISSIQLGSKNVERFRQSLKAWIDKVISHRDWIEIACGERQLPDHISAGKLYSYERGHIGEYEVQAMIRDLVHTLRNPGGRTLTKAQKKAKSDQRNARDENKKEPRQLVGLTLLSTSASNKGLGEARRTTVYGENSGSGEGGSDGEADKQKSIKHTSGVARWSASVEKDTKEKMRDAEFRPTNYLPNYLYWLVKVKSDLQWQPPLLACIDELRKSCVEEVVELIAKNKPDLVCMQGKMNEKYIVIEDFRFSDKKVPAHAHLLPMGAFSGKNLKTNLVYETMDTFPVPAHFFFGYSKSDVTHQKVEAMKECHMERLKWVGKYCTHLVEAIDTFLDELLEDIAMSSSLESLMPSPPPMSHLYLKHCEGREIDDDACTPRSEEHAESSDDGTMDVIALASATPAGVHDSSDHGSRKSQSINEMGVATSKIREGRKKRIDRNIVLSHVKPGSRVTTTNRE